MWTSILNLTYVCRVVQEMKCANEQINRHNFMHSVQRIYKNMVTWITLMRKSNNTFRTPLTKKKKKKKQNALKTKMMKSKKGQIPE
jgi:fucose permease